MIVVPTTQKNAKEELNVIKKYQRYEKIEKEIPFETVTFKGILGEEFGKIIYSFNVNRMLYLFEQKRIQAIKDNPKLGNRYLLQEHLNNLAIGTSKELKKHHKKIVDTRRKECLSILKKIDKAKNQELNLKITIEKVINPPKTTEECEIFRNIVKNKIREVFGENTEDYMSDLLINAWMRKKELEQDNIKEEDLVRTNKNIEGGI